jgi:hypothetical protein
VERARFLLSEDGQRIRAQAVASARSARQGRAEELHWRELLAGAEEAGRAAARAEAENAPEDEGPRGSKREAEQRVRRALRRHRTEALDLGLSLCGLWFRDLAVVAGGAGELIHWSDRGQELEEDAQGLSPAAARRACDLVADTRQRLEQNVSEELALEALFYRLEDVLTS